MSYANSEWAWREDVGNPIRKLILLHIAQAAHPNNRNETWHSMGTIAKACNCSTRSAAEHMKALQEAGYIVLLRSGKKAGTSNKYRLKPGKITVESGPGKDEWGYAGAAEGGMQELPRGMQELPTGYAGAAEGGMQELPRGMQELPTGYAGAADKPVIEPVSNQKEKGGAPPTEKMTPANHHAVIDLYHEILPELPRVARSRWLGGEHAKALAARWREDPKFRTADFWRNFFDTIRENDWWMGRAQDRDGKTFEVPGLRWFVKRANFDKVLEAGGFE